MAGFYVHIPFCRQACRYCDFHFSVSLAYKPDLLSAMVQEIKHKQKQFQGLRFKTLYFGGGTPSVLDIAELKLLKESILSRFDFDANPEISLEANPDDLTISYLKALGEAGINRLSVGVQSFHDRDLELMRRSHNSQQALQSVIQAQHTGITNINVDLIYGIPGLKLSEWESNLDKTIDLGIPHVSAYHLTFEPGTVFDHWRKKGRMIPVEENSSIEQFALLKSKLAKAGFEHYEISNFAKPGFRSAHNTLYWKQVPYLGIGPSAHSLVENRRYWNISNNRKYVEYIRNNEAKYYEYEDLSITDRYNEYLLTGLRTIWGIDLDEISSGFGDNYVKYTFDIFKVQEKRKLVYLKGKKIFLTEKGLFLSDQVIREFFRI